MTVEFNIAFLGDDERSQTHQDWEEREGRETSRNVSVKFSEDSIMDRDTPFVRQNTPHPKELKAKAHKLFAKERSKQDDAINIDTFTEEVRIELF